jgi:KH/beta-lactamase-domain protein
MDKNLWLNKFEILQKFCKDIVRIIDRNRRDDMTISALIEEIQKSVKKHLPAKIEISKIELEGPIVVVYTKSLEEFADNSEIVKKLAQGLRRRVAIRPDPSLLVDLDQADTEIRHIIPEEAQITDIYFEKESGEVTIEALSPGLAIGKHGSILNEIKKRIGWAPKVVRTPPIPSKTIKEIRNYLRSIDEERKEFLKKVGYKIYRDIPADENWIRTTGLGGYREVGRSCTLLTTRNSKCLVDIGLNVSVDENGSPYLNLSEVLPLESIDGIVVTHAHLDHSGLVPLLYKFGYRGPTYCTQPTRDMMSLLQIDYLKVAASEGKKAPYESSHIRDVLKHCIPLRYGDTTDIAPDIRLTFQNAGHILGSAIAHFHIGDGMHNVAITGDLKYEKTWLFNPSVNKFPRLETLIIESTYGGHQDYQPPRKEAANQLKTIIRKTIKRGGKVLIPVFAVGRSQEVMIVIQQSVQNSTMAEVPVYLDGMIMEATAIHTAYPEFLNNSLRNSIFQRRQNPFLSEIFKHVDSSEVREQICDGTDPAIVLATSGMLNGGPVMEYFKAWAPDKKNTIVFVGYQAEGTMGRRIQRGLKEVTINEKGTQVPVEINFELAICDGFSGHSDRKQLLNYMYNLDPRPERIIMCHGDESKCTDLASTIYKKYGIETKAPMNLETIRYR